MPFHKDMSPLFMLHRAEQVAAALFEKAFANRDLTYTQFLVLMCAAENRGASQKQVTEMTSIDRATMADVATRLGHKGLIVRRRSRDDARRYNLSLTAEGALALEEARPLVQAIDAQLLAALTPSEAHHCMQVLAVLTQAQRGDASGAK